MTPAARFATLADDAALRALARAVTMTGPLSYSLEREPSYFSLTRLQGDDARVAVVDGDQPGSLAAMAATAFMRARVGGRELPLAYTADAKVLPDARGAGRFRAVQRLLGDEVDRRGLPFAFGLVLRRNALMRGVMDHGRTIRYRRVAVIRNVSLLHALARTRRPSVPVRPAREADLGAMASLWARAHAKRDLVPVRDEGSFRRLFGLDGAPATPGLSIDCVRVAERGARLTGFLLPWDAGAIKQVRLRRLSAGLGALRCVYDPVARLLGRPTMPRAGELLRFLYLALPTAETAEDLSALIAAAAAEARGGDALYLDIALDRTDPLGAALRAWPRTHVDFDLVELTTRPRPPALSAGRVHYFEMAFV